MNRYDILIIGLIVLLLACFLCSCSLPYMGNVVDSQTGQPIEGAVIVRSWNRISATPAGGVTSFVDLSEGLSSNSGSFYVDGIIHFPDIPLLSNTFETSAAYKPGYKFRAMKEKSWNIKLEKIPTLNTSRHEELDKAEQEHYIERWHSRIYNDILSKEEEFIDILKEPLKNPVFWFPFSPLESNHHPTNNDDKILANISILSDRKEHVSRREQVMLILTKSKDPRAIEAIAETLNEAPMRHSAVYTLAQFQDIRAESYLIDALNDADPSERYAAAQGLINYKDERALHAFSKHINDDYGLVRLMAQKALGVYSSPDGQKEIAVLIKELADQSQREMASYKLVMIGQQAVDKLIDALRNSDKNIAAWAAITLRSIKDPKAIDPLIDNLNRNDDRSQAAAYALGNFDDPRAAKALVNALHYDENLSANIQNGIARMGHVAVEYLVIALHDQDVKVRRSAALILSSVRDPGSVDALIAALNDEDVYVREYAANALALVRDPKSVVSFSKLLNDRDSRVRLAAASALVNADSLSTKRRIFEFEHQKTNNDIGIEWLRATVEKYHPFDSAAVKHLILGLGDINPYIRWRSAWCLGERREQQAVAALTILLHDNYSEVRWVAIDALEKIRDDRAVNNLVEICRDSDSGIRDKAGKALTTITGANKCLQDSRGVTTAQ